MHFKSNHLLIFAWEYNGYHSVQGAALARRIRQVAESFRQQQWAVTVIHKDQRSECGDKPWCAKTEANGIKRILVKDEADTSRKRNALARRAETFYYVWQHGDRSHLWAKNVIKYFPELNVAQPGLIISFYTPRSPLYLGHYFSKKLNAPWIADIQDPILAGLSGRLKYVSRQWAAKILATANARVHISPEWAAADAAETGYRIDTIRHAVPMGHAVPDTGPATEFRKLHKDTFLIFYGGSLSPEIQSLDLLKEVLTSSVTAGHQIKIMVAGNENVAALFRKTLGSDMVAHLGWLNHNEMAGYIMASNCTLVIPWSKERIGIPSKFYEFCSFDKPIWIIGNDLGAFASLMKEWEYPGLQITNADYQKKALAAALQNNYSLLFNVSRCKGNVLKEQGLYESYINLL